MSGFVGLGTALSGLRAAQLGLDVSSQNVANANTPGYTRQRVLLSSAPMYDTAVGPMGTGVQVDGIDRTRDAFLDRRLRLAVSDRERDGLRADLLSRAEGVLAEPDLGISSDLGVLWDSFEELALDPSDGAARSQVLASLDRVAGRIRDVASGWGDLADDTSLRMRTTASEVNRITNRLAVLNGEIPVATRLSGSPNGLQDERDLLLDRLASLSGASATAEADGTVTVTIGGETVVRGTRTWAVSASDDGTVSVAAGDPPTRRAVTAGGELGGASMFLRTELPAQRAALDELASDLAASLAAVHGTGRNADAPRVGSCWTPAAVRPACGCTPTCATGPTDWPRGRPGSPTTAAWPRPWPGCARTPPRPAPRPSTRSSERWWSPSAVRCSARSARATRPTGSPSLPRAHARARTASASTRRWWTSSATSAASRPSPA